MRSLVAQNIGNLATVASGPDNYYLFHFGLMMIAKPVRSDYPHRKVLLSMDKRGPQRLKIIHICAAVEGATWMIEQLRELRERHGHDVYACVIREDCDFADRLRAAGVKCLPLAFNYQSVKQMALMPLTTDSSTISYSW